MKILAILIVLFAFATPAFTQPVGIMVKGNNYQGVIFPAELKHNPQDSVTRWTPTEEDVRLLEQNLQSYMAAQSKKSVVNQNTSGPKIHQELSSYVRQYTGFISLKGEKMIFVNSFYYQKNDLIAKDYDKRLIQVFDGGSYYWQIYYNVFKKKFNAFSVNGVA